MTPNLLAQKLMHNTLGTRKSSIKPSPTQLSCSMAGRSSPLQLRSLDVNQPHHISPALLQRIRFALCCLRSLLLTASLLISLPPGTKMLQFPGYAILTDRFRNPWLKDRMRLTKAYRSLPRPSSPAEPSYPLSGVHGFLQAFPPKEKSLGKKTCGKTLAIELASLYSNARIIRRRILHAPASSFTREKTPELRSQT